MEKKLKNAILITILLIGTWSKSNAQDMNYSQYFSAPIYYNPAYTGINPGVRARFLYRNQWPALPVSLKSYFFSAELGDRNLPGSGGLGLVINQDTPGYGLITNFAASVTMGVRVPVGDNLMSEVGIKAGILERRINWDELVFPGQLDPRYGIVNPPPPYALSTSSKRLVADFGCGGALMFISGDDRLSGNIGLGVDHLFQPDVSFLSNDVSPYPRKWVGQFELLINTGPGRSMSSSVVKGSDNPLMINIGAIYQNQAAVGALQVGLTALEYNIYAGAWYKTTFGPTPNNSLAVVAGYRYFFYENMSIKAMYSYDIQISKALQGTGGAHEISLIIDLADLMLFGGSSGYSRGGGFVPGGSSRGGKGEWECPAFY